MREGLRADLVRLHRHHRGGQGEHSFLRMTRLYQTVIFAEEGSQGNGDDEVTQHRQSCHGGAACHADSQGKRDHHISKQSAVTDWSHIHHCLAVKSVNSPTVKTARQVPG